MNLVKIILIGLLVGTTSHPQLQAVLYNLRPLGVISFNPQLKQSFKKCLPRVKVTEINWVKNIEN